MLKNRVLDLEPRMNFNHHPNLPSSFRMLIIGSSGSGKTCLLLNMLLESGFMDYNNLIIFTPTKSQQEYQLLYHGYSNGLSKESIAAILLNQEQFKGVLIPTLCRRYAELHKQSGGVTCRLTDRTDDLIPPDKLDRSKKNLIIFDDCVTAANQAILGSYFIKGRHNSCNTIYLSQSYFGLNQMIRLNTNILVLFKLSQRKKTDVFNSDIGKIIDKKDFDALTSNVWSKKHRYIVVNRESEKIFDDIFNEAESDTESE